jgi:hypothetical protein
VPDDRVEPIGAQRLAARRSRERNDADNRSREEQAPRQNGDTHRYEHGTARSSRGLGDKGQGKENPRSFGDRNPEGAQQAARATGGERRAPTCPWHRVMPSAARATTMACRIRPALQPR